MNETICNKCKKWIKIDESLIKKTNIELEEGLCEVQYFNCEHCKQVYLIYIQTSETEILQINYMKYIRQMKTCARLGNKPKKKLVRNYQDAKDKITKAQKTLLEKYKDKIVVT